MCVLCNSLSLHTVHCSICLGPAFRDFPSCCNPVSDVQAPHGPDLMFCGHCGSIQPSATFIFYPPLPAAALCKLGGAIDSRAVGMGTPPAMTAAPGGVICLLYVAGGLARCSGSGVSEPPAPKICKNTKGEKGWACALKGQGRRSMIEDSERAKGQGCERWGC